MSEDLYLTTGIDSLCFIDTETLSSADLKEAGLYAYADAPDYRVMIVTYAIGGGPVRTWLQTEAHSGGWLDWTHAPEDLLAFSEQVEAGRAWFVAWNAGFDRQALSRGVKNGEWIRPEHFLDAMAQAVRTHLPADLASAGRMCKSEIQKRPEGKRLIKLFCSPPFADPAAEPQAWADFVLYAQDDIPPMRSVWQATLPLSRTEWEQYWTSEYINDRGMPVDVDLAEAASEYAEENARRANADIRRLTGGAINTVNQSTALAKWVAARLTELPDALRILTREVIEEPEAAGEDVTEIPVYSLERSRVEDLIAYLERRDADVGLTDEEFDVYKVLQVRAYGASATPRKFTKLLPMISEGDRLRGQYVFNGAAATGRFSSRGLQIHNLTRATVGPQTVELAVIDEILDRVPFECLQEYGPPGRTLSRLIRPVFAAPDGHKMVWSDWSAIEARVTPWLGEDYGGGKVLDVFRKNDADPSLPDIYRVEAGKILRKPATEVTKAERQSHGKVPVLSLGFGGGKGALFAMARNYGASFTDAEAGEIVSSWRAENRWAVNFWEDTWEAALWCMHNPNILRPVGSRLVYVYMPDYMHGTLVCLLPDGRPLLYPVLRWEKRERVDKITGKTTVKEQLTYRRGYGRSALWYGTLVENAVQAVAGSILRHCLWRLERDYPQLVVGHTHDEIIGLVKTQDAAAGRAALETVMLDLPPAFAGLPIACETSESFYYTKTVD